MNIEPDQEYNLKKEIVKGAKAVFNKGLVDVAEGNVSIRIPNRDELFITPTFNQYGSMNEKDVVHLKFDGTQLSEGRSASTEYRLHVAIYRIRPKAKCVIHTHSTYATILSIIRKKIPVMMEEMIVLLGGEVNISEFGPAHTESIGENVIKALGKTNAALLANHGVLVTGRNMDYTIKIAELVEKMAKIYWGTLQIEEPAPIPDEFYSKFIDDFDLNFSTI
ncbi:class II aldolase/adducin family protein [[Eubacterium] cellulosolvens]